MSDKDRLLADWDEVKIKGNAEKWEDLQTFFYDPDAYEHFGRKPTEWGKYFINYTPKTAIDL